MATTSADCDYSYKIVQNTSHKAAGYGGGKGRVEAVRCDGCSHLLAPSSCVLLRVTSREMLLVEPTKT